VMISLEKAQRQLYRPCRTCGGQGTVRLLDGSAC
jgi:hypothetical protein